MTNPVRRTTKAALEAELARVKHELSVVVSTRHKEASASALRRQLTHFEAGMRRYAKGVEKYREQHILDKDYIQRLKRELRRLNALVAPSERAQVSQINVDDACPLCGCSFPATDHEAVKRNLRAVVESRNTLLAKLKAIVGERRRTAHDTESEMQRRCAMHKGKSTS